jgi:hypothetical protein
MNYNPPAISQLSNFMTVRRVRAKGYDITAPRDAFAPLSTLVTHSPAPPIGTVNPGELLVDAQYKTMWLGVDPSVDVTQSILLCDMAALLAIDDTLLAEARAYTDAQVALRAPLKHTHPSTDITDLEQTVNALIQKSSANWQRGMIQMFSGDARNIGFDWSTPGHNPAGQNLLGWALCDGNNGTPDLKDKFVIGAGNKSIGVQNPQPGNVAQGHTDGGGRHNHYSASGPGYTGNTFLDANQIPPHTHSIGAVGSHTHPLTKFGSAQSLEVVTNAASAEFIRPKKKYWIDDDTNQVTGAASIAAGGETGINVTSNNAHRHEIFEVGDHTHTTPGNFYETGLPWYSLAFIMRL